jgi:hypothetical protein
LEESNRTQDVILYHFDYLTLLLSGAIDATLRIAKQVFDVRVKDSNVGLWKESFRRELKTAAPAVDAVLMSTRAEALKPLLSALRNTIHEQRLGSMAFTDRNRNAPRIAVVNLGPSRGPAALKAAAQLGGTDRWGMLTFPGYPMEPFSYASALVAECFHLLEDLSDTIDERLLQTQTTKAPPQSIPQLFSPDQMRRIELLA